VTTSPGSRIIKDVHKAKGKRIKMTKKNDGNWSILAALMVLFSAMLPPLVSAGIAFAALIIYGGGKRCLKARK
jgi:hypothetical protein